MLICRDLWARLGSNQRPLACEAMCELDGSPGNTDPPGDHVWSRRDRMCVDVRGCVRIPAQESGVCHNANALPSANGQLEDD